MTDFPTLETARLHLREIVAADAPALYTIHGLPNAAAMRWFGTDPLPTLADAEKLVETFAGWRRMANPGTRWGLVDKADGRLVGSCGLFKWNRGWKACALGYELAPAAWGRGLMREALAAVLPWGFAQMALNRIEAQIAPENEASLRLARRFGFALEGRLREAAFWGDAHHDLLQFSLLARECRLPELAPV